MTDLQINIALAQSMGWVETNARYLSDASSGSYMVSAGNLWCLPSDGHPHEQKIFDYRDPVVFVAICKHWQLVANFEGFVSGVSGIDLIGSWQRDCIEKAAALVVIELAKRGVK